MSSAERAVPRAAGAPYFARPGTVFMRRVMLAVFIGWTAFWTYSAYGMVRAHSKIGSGTYGSTIDGHEIFEFVFVASHCLVRWAPLAVPLFGFWLWTGWQAKREPQG